MTDYSALNAQLAALVEGVPHPISNLSNAAALLFHSLPDLNWAGFYLLEGEKLVLPSLPVVRRKNLKNCKEKPCFFYCFDI